MNDNEAPGANPFAPPQAEVADVAVSGPVLGGRWRRLCAAILDGVIQGGAFWIVNLAWPGGLMNKAGTLDGAMQNAAAGVVLFLLIQSVPLVRNGQTVGKMLLGLRIVRADGGRASPLRLLGLRYGVSYLLALVPLVGGIWALVDSLFIFRDSRQCLHDQIADTIVVNA